LRNIHGAESSMIYCIIFLNISKAWIVHPGFLFA
jgi:hypothetical protein